MTTLWEPNYGYGGGDTNNAGLLFIMSFQFKKGKKKLEQDQI